MSKPLAYQPPITEGRHTSMRLPVAIPSPSRGQCGPCRFGLMVVAVLSLLAGASAAELLVPAAGPVPVERLTIQYQAGRFQLLSRSPLIKILPPSDQLPGTQGEVSGFWFEVQIANGEVKYRRLMPNPLVVYTEVPDPAQPSLPVRAENVTAETVFSLLIPQLPGSNNLVLVSSPLGAAAAAQPAQPLALIPLAEVSK